MAASQANNQKIKLLELLKILFEHTDEERGLTMPQIIESLAERGIDAERKAIYRDLAALEACGFEVEHLRTSPVQYALVSRPFTEGELRLLIDSVQSSRFLTEGKSASLVRAIKSLASKRQREDLSHRLHVEGRIKMQNESVFYNLDAIQRALAYHRKISFLYFRYNVNKKRVLRREGRRYEASPVQLTYVNDCYYLVTYSDKYEDFANYRLDRMLDIEVLDEKAARNAQVANFDLEEYCNRSFGMYTGESVAASFIVDEVAMGAVIDRFGFDVEVLPVDADHARVHAVVMESPTFFGWLAERGTHMTIEHPATLKKSYQEYLQGILQEYG